LTPDPDPDPLARGTDPDPHQNVTDSQHWYAVLRILDVYLRSRILIVIHPGSWIPDPTTATKEKGEKFVVLPFL
jgi:hypothetical protein